MTLLARIAGLALLALTSVGASNCSAVKLKPDSAMAAVPGADYTALLEGCGQQLNAGMLYCRVREGDVSDTAIAIVGPAAQCSKNKKEPCVTYKIFFPNGEPAIGGAIPRGETRASIRWADLVKRPHFVKGDRGFWTINTTVKWIGPDGRLNTSVAQGEILLRVYDANYIPLHEVAEDTNFAWRWVENGIDVKATTGMRVYVEKRP